VNPSERERRLREVEAMPTASPPEDPYRRIWTAPELLATDFPDPRFAIEGIVPEGLTFLGGAPKIGKSWLVLGTGIAVATGGRAFASIPVEAGEVLYLALEDSPRRIADRLRKVLDGVPAPAGLHVVTAFARIDDGGLEHLRTWLAAHPRCRLVIVDTWPRFRPRASRSGDYFTLDYQAVEPLQALAAEEGLAIVVLTHTRKAEADDWIDALQGTLGTAAAADTLLVVKRSRSEADATLHVTGREVSEQQLALRFVAVAGTWEILGDAATYALGETRRELLEALQVHGSLTPKQAADVTGLDHNGAKVALWRMAQDGQVVAKRGSYYPP
jgi:hypothetical protein